MANYNEHMQQLYHRYREEVGIAPVSLRIVADWAIKNGSWKPQPGALVRQCADQMAVALREEFYTDPQGRRVRINHAVRTPIPSPSEQGEQSALWEWDDIRTATRQHMQLAFQQRRQAIVNDCLRLMTDAASFNENNLAYDPIQLTFNFTLDLEEIDSRNLELVAPSVQSSSGLPDWLKQPEMGRMNRE